MAAKVTRESERRRSPCSSRRPVTCPPECSASTRCRLRSRSRWMARILPRGCNRHRQLVNVLDVHAIGVEPQRSRGSKGKIRRAVVGGSVECCTKSTMLFFPAPKSVHLSHFLKLEPAVGFEPTTDGLQNRCSTTELCWPWHAEADAI